MPETPLAAGPLSDVRVLELADWIAGPFAGQLLGDLGADVVKIERPGVLSNSRTNGLMEPEDPDRSTYFATAARNKRSLTLDVRKPEGRELFLRLVERSDVLIESFRPLTMERWDLGWSVLEQVNPRLVCLRISGYGQTGPLRDLPGFDRVAQAFGGLTYITGTPDGPPVRSGVGVADYGTGLFGAFGVLAALHEREQSGRGQVIDLALYETILSMQGRVATEYLRGGIVRERTGNFHPDIAPGDVYRTADDAWLHISASGDALWERLARDVLGRPDLLEDERFTTKSSRARHRDELDAVLAPWVGERDADVVEATLREAGVAASRVMSIADVLTHPHVRARGNVISVDDPVFGPIEMVEPLPHLSRTPGTVRSTGPGLGHDTRDILGDLLGVDDEAFSRLRDEGIV